MVMRSNSAALCDAGAGRERIVRQYLASEARWVDTRTTDYDALGNPIQLIEGGVTRHLEYDAYSLHATAETVQPSSTRTLRWEAGWDNVQGQPILVRGPSGLATVITYDGLARPLSLAREGSAPYTHYRYRWTSPRSYVETFVFDGDADAVSALPDAWTSTSGWRHTVDVTNSAAEHVFSATQLGDAAWIVAGWKQRDALGRSVATADHFDWIGPLASLAAAMPPVGTAVQTATYDALDRVVSQTLPTGAQKRYAYSAFVTTLTVDGMGPVSSILDGQDRITMTTRTIDGVVESVVARYDAAGRITSMKVPGTGSTAPVTAAEHRFEYDTLGRLAFATDPDVGDRHLTYDDGGRLLSSTNGVGQVVQYAYDGAGRLATTQATDGSRFVYHYDDALDSATFGNTAGALSWVEEPTGQVELGYDTLGHVAHRRRMVNGRVGDELMTYAPSGLVRRLGYGDGLGLDIAYDPAGRAIGVGDLWHLESQDPAGRIRREQFGNHVVQTYERDVLGQATHLQILRPSGAALFDAGVTYNPYGSIAAITDTDGQGLDHSAAFTYDGGARLVDAVLGQGQAQYHFKYQYDGLQNMTRREAHGPQALGVLTGTYRYGETTASRPRGPRQLTSVLPDATDGSPIGATTTTFDYDAAGRMVRQGALTLDYNGFDQLVSVHGLVAGGGTVEHAYGYDGLRVFSRDPGGHGERWFTPEMSQTDDGVTQHYVRVGDRLIARVTQSPALARAETTRHDARVARALHAGLGGGGLVFVLAALVLPRRRGARGRAALSTLLVVISLLAGCGARVTSTTAALATTSQTLYYHRAVGVGPSVVTRADGTIFEERRYEPFGVGVDAYRELEGGGAETGAVDYTRERHNILNKPTDPATGWSDHGARWMVPETGRWLTPDPPVKAPDAKYMAQPWELHPYQYVNQNPVLYWDPNGEGWKSWLREFGATAVEAGATAGGAAGGFVLSGFNPLGGIGGAALGAGAGHIAGGWIRGEQATIGSTANAMAWGATYEMAGQVLWKVGAAALKAIRPPSGARIRPIAQLPTANSELAEELTDIAGRAKSKQPAMVIGAKSRVTGEATAGRSSPGPTGCCAEVDAAGKLGGDPKEIDFTMPVRPRTGEAHPVCTGCQLLFDRSQFPPGTQFE